MSEEERKFIKETVKEKPVNKKRIVIRFAISAICGAIFALVACGIMALLLPKMTAVDELMSSTTKDSENDKNTSTDLIDEKQPEEIIHDEGSDISSGADSVDDVSNADNTVTSEDMYNDAVSTIYKAGLKADKSVVKVTGVTSELDLFNSPYENAKAGCGLIMGSSDEGLLVLAESKLIDDSSNISIEFYDGVVAEAIEYASDEQTGLSMVLIPGENLDNDYREKCQVASLAITFAPKVGQGLLAIGAPQGKLHGIVKGNVTSVGDQINAADANYSYFLTDFINMRESEGYLCNHKGEIVGFMINNFSGDMPGSCICAVTAGELKSTIDKLMAGENMPYMGIVFNVVTEKISSEYYIPRGIYIKETVLDSPAMQAGFMPGDIITHIEDEEVYTEAMFEKIVRNLVPGEKTDMTIRRQSAEGYVELHYEITPSINK